MLCLELGIRYKHLDILRWCLRYQTATAKSRMYAHENVSMFHTMHIWYCVPGINGTTQS